MFDAVSVPSCPLAPLFFLCMFFSSLCGFPDPACIWTTGCKMENNRVTLRFCSAINGERVGTPLSWFSLVQVCCEISKNKKKFRTGRKAHGCQHWGENKIRGLDKTQDHFPPQFRHFVQKVPHYYCWPAGTGFITGKQDSGEAAGINAVAALTTSLPPPSLSGFCNKHLSLRLGHADV